MAKRTAESVAVEDTVPARPRTPSPKDKLAALLEKHKEFGGISVIERRLLNPDHDPGSIDIRLKDEPSIVQDPQGKKRTWYVRWINSGQDGRFASVTDIKGYRPVKLDELPSKDAIAGLSESKDGFVRRGDRGQEILVKMPLELYNAIKAAQIDSRARRSRNAKLVKEDLANLAGSAHGSEAGDIVHDEMTVSVKHGRKQSWEELADSVSEDEA